jgi:REP element-mobilizing transposase RayT
VEHDDAFALHITWTCYGTWLPGDVRGYVSNTRLPEGGFRRKENTPGTPCTADDEYTRQRAQERQKWPTVGLSAQEAQVAAQALVAAARARGWQIVRGAVMPNHLHLVVTDCPDDGPAVRRILKGTSQAALSDHAKEKRRWWTQGGSDRYKHGEEAVSAAIRYVADQPGRLVEIVEMEVREVQKPVAVADA